MYDLLISGGTVVDGTGAAPRTADVAIEGDRIVAVGDVDGRARRVIDADGAVVTPGFLDIHTHYDGQVTWDDALEPSATNGVSTVVLGNCGVGFAPVRASDHEALIDMMEGVEDIPGTALSLGMPWGRWESFGDYLDLIDSRRYATDVACHIAHGPLRYYVMGDRAYDDIDASADDVAEMARLLREAMDAGAAGFSTNRFEAHKSRSRRTVPGTFAPSAEVLALADAVGASGHGILQAITDGTTTPDDPTDLPELALFAEASMRSGRPLTFSLVQASRRGDVFRHVLEQTDGWNARGAQLRPQVIPRAVTFMLSLSTYHPFMHCPSYLAVEHLPLAERARALRDDEVRTRVLEELEGHRRGVAGFLLTLVAGGSRTFALDFPVDYEPDACQSMKARAAAAGRTLPEQLYDEITAGGGDTFLAVLSSNFADGTLEPSLEMLRHPDTVSGLSDAGAHVNVISDCSASTFHLTHWVRDRTKGERIPLEWAVHKLTGAPAAMYGFVDRGQLVAGRKADINVIDFERLAIQAPFARDDLPTGATRVLQPSTGYLKTMVGGVVVRDDDADTGERPGRLVRSGR